MSNEQSTSIQFTCQDAINSFLRLAEMAEKDGKHGAAKRARKLAEKLQNAAKE